MGEKKINDRIARLASIEIQLRRYKLTPRGRRLDKKYKGRELQITRGTKEIEKRSDTTKEIDFNRDQPSDR